MAIWRWTPDTCEEPRCIIEYEGESAIMGGAPEEQPAGTVIRAVHLCRVHSDHDSARGDNQRKNLTFREFEQRVGVQPEEFIWAFDEDRVLHVSLLGRTVPPADRAQIENSLRSRFGNAVRWE